MHPLFLQITSCADIKSYVRETFISMSFAEVTSHKHVIHSVTSGTKPSDAELPRPSTKDGRSLGCLCQFCFFFM